MLLRFRTKDGMFRVPTQPTDDFLLPLEDLLKNHIKAPSLAEVYISNSQSARGELAAGLCGKTVTDLGFKHGDMLFVTYPADAATSSTPVNGVSAPSVAIAGISKVSEPLKVTQLPVDDFLQLQTGIIPVPKSRLCRHNDGGMCEYCSPLPPWSKIYQEEHKIKHISFTAQLKKLLDGKNADGHSTGGQGTSYVPPLDASNFTVDFQCRNGHKPYPGGICSKCVPSAITLQLQQFRMVDHVEFSDSTIVNDFIEAWRISGLQRIGYLYGTYEAYDKVPLGIKAVVQAIYEPPQTNEGDGLKLEAWEDEKHVDELASRLGIYKVGVIFTDLLDTGKGDGSVVCKRHKDSYFLSSLEVLLAANFQLANPNVSKYSKSGVYSSKFVTCVISGNAKDEIDIAAYQVSEAAEALAKADIVTGSTHPSMAFINETTDKRYVPEIFYSKRNEYNLVVKENAKPAFPVEYLLVSLTHGFPENPEPMFASKKKFPIEYRGHVGVAQEIRDIRAQVGSDVGDGAGLKDFHLLAHLQSMDVLSGEEFGLVGKFVQSGKYEDYLQVVQSPGWQTLMAILS
ncbi:hypothetical protein BABINDRAFT_85393 [Babjeviella inositovora NRRL Y-12698]|uniref:Nuclear protein localization protein 4 n=1 Tax=Babjeviella inositovora NRRL Y-12698 TaxID=984486 RepID=A0A1E3QLD7_9ASCO|nr:uncharacterized protein BABINDRAFT_85393 [Babjeviella inositovora NRRL Y-12698]ODQ78501.1 hypothetical protein BABINDRAFT_85393 [Babjeviella inositovora NRRL Y-12698]